MKRKYTKKNTEYWNGLKPREPVPANIAQAQSPVVDIGFDEQPHFSSVAACGGGTPNEYRSNFSESISPVDSYKNIENGLLPWEMSNGNISIARAIVLCQKAYANVSIVKTSIESAVEFSNSELYVESDNKTVQDFFTQWFNTINIYKLKDVVFREYYRSGNVPIYKFVGKINNTDYGRLQSVFGAKSPFLPIRYIVLNPAQVSVQGGLGYNDNFVKILSTYEIERLKVPRTPQDKQIFDSLPDSVKKSIKAGGSFPNILIPLDPARLTMLFYKKQDYEPMAMPMIFPVLNDIEWKLELKKMDMTIGRMIEHAILLVTAGEKADQYNSRYNPQNIANLRTIFKSQSLGRVLVGDHTTKAEWVIPPIDKILGPEKYQQVEADIREGLQSIVMGEDKFANAQIKARVFIEKMKEGQKAFLNNFLIPEIKNICEVMNFRNVPNVRFAEINLNDPSTISRVYLRLAELGILSPDEVINAIETGILPNKASNLLNQKEYQKMREDGLYAPLLGGPKPGEEGGTSGRPAGTKTPKATDRKVPQGMASDNTDKINKDKIIELIPVANKLKDNVVKALKKQFKIKGDLTPEQIEAASTLSKTIILHEDINDWNKSIASYLKTLPEMDGEKMRQVDEMAIKYDLDDWSALIAWKAKIHN